MFEGVEPVCRELRFFGTSPFFREIQVYPALGKGKLIFKSAVLGGDIYVSSQHITELEIILFISNLMILSNLFFLG